MDKEYNFEGRTEQEVLLSFTANKGHRTRQAKKINNLLTLHDQKYSKATEQTLLQVVSALERYQDRLNIFSSWLNIHQLESAVVHVAEAVGLTAATETLVNRVMEQIHNYDPPVVAGGAGGAGGAGILAGQQQPQGPTAKPIMALKPEKLSLDSNLGQVRRWKQRFRAFHASSNLRVLSIPD